MPRCARLLSSLVLLGLVAACRSQQEAPPEATAENRPQAMSESQPSPSRDAAKLTPPTLAALQNLTYQGLESAPGPVALVDGRWEGEPLAPGGAARPRVHFVRDFHLVGDVDGDGQPEGVVLLGASGGGTGDLIHVAVVARRDERWQNVATAVVGDRVQLRAARLAGGGIVLDVVQAGVGDAMCCPGDLVTRAWKFTGAGLTEAPAVPTGRLSLATLAGTEWVLRSWAWDEAAPSEPEVTLVVEHDRFAGRSGCNRYVAPVTADAMPGALRLGPAAGTRMACPEPAAGVELRFLSQLQGVKRFGFMAGQLALSYEKDGVQGTMLFMGRTLERE